jgi:hypothetical protein
VPAWSLQAFGAQEKGALVSPPIAQRDVPAVGHAWLNLIVSPVVLHAIRCAGPASDTMLGEAIM